MKIMSVLLLKTMKKQNAKRGLNIESRDARPVDVCVYMCVYPVAAWTRFSVLPPVDETFQIACIGQKVT